MKVTVVSEQGKEAVVAILGTNEFFGEGCLAGQTQRIATVATMTDSVIVRLEKAAIVRVIHQEPAFSEMFIAHLLGRTIRVEADLVDQLFNSSEKRLARLLLLLANFGKEGKPEPMIAKISQETLAEMIGTTRSRVSFFMNKFRKLGFIDYNGEHRSPQFIVECRSARAAAHQDLNVLILHFADPHVRRYAPCSFALTAIIENTARLRRWGSRLLSLLAPVDPPRRRFFDQGLSSGPALSLTPLSCDAFLKEAKMRFRFAGESNSAQTSPWIGRSFKSKLGDYSKFHQSYQKKK